MSGGSSQQTQQAQLDPEIKAAYLANLERATGVAESLAPRTIAPLGSGFEGAKAGISNAMADRGQTSDFAIGGLQRAINLLLSRLPLLKPPVEMSEMLALRWVLI